MKWKILAQTIRSLRDSQTNLKGGLTYLRFLTNVLNKAHLHKFLQSAKNYLE